MFDRLFVTEFFLRNIPKNDIADQFAFKPTGSTTAALSYIFSNITETLQSADHVRCFLIDFSKAFDTVPHAQLLTKLEAQGCNPVISWLADYLTDRTQSLATNGSCTTDSKPGPGSRLRNRPLCIHCLYIRSKTMQQRNDLL